MTWYSEAGILPLSTNRSVCFCAFNCAVFLFVQIPQRILSSSATWLYIFVCRQKKNGPWHCIYFTVTAVLEGFWFCGTHIYAVHYTQQLRQIRGTKVSSQYMCVFLLKGQGEYFKSLIKQPGSLANSVLKYHLFSGPSCCGATSLTTVPPCCPDLHHYLYYVTEQFFGFVCY